VKLKKCDYTQSFMKVNKSTLLLLYQKVQGVLTGKLFHPFSIFQIFN